MPRCPPTSPTDLHILQAQHVQAPRGDLQWKIQTPILASLLLLLCCLLSLLDTFRFHNWVAEHPDLHMVSRDLASNFGRKINGNQRRNQKSQTDWLVHFYYYNYLLFFFPSVFFETFCETQKGKAPDGAAAVSSWLHSGSVRPRPNPPGNCLLNNGRMPKVWSKVWSFWEFVTFLLGLEVCD